MYISTSSIPTNNIDFYLSAWDQRPRRAQMAGLFWDILNELTTIWLPLSPVPACACGSTPAQSATINNTAPFGSPIPAIADSPFAACDALSLRITTATVSGWLILRLATLPALSGSSSLPSSLSPSASSLATTCAFLIDRPCALRPRPSASLPSLNPLPLIFGQACASHPLGTQFASCPVALAPTSPPRPPFPPSFRRLPAAPSSRADILHPSPAAPAANRLGLPSPAISWHPSLLTTPPSFLYCAKPFPHPIYRASRRHFPAAYSIAAYNHSKHTGVSLSRIPHPWCFPAPVYAAATLCTASQIPCNRLAPRPLRPQSARPPRAP
ncbi:hypothetical protein B0H10DRAFT_2233250 [Mycena sp. CBHHK59/15]|nr:hypothetical protein B0H10DRAFT_2233250 [Mycena sp. CBHHK59/15]